MKSKNIFLTIVFGLGLGVMPGAQAMDSSASNAATVKRERKRAQMSEQQKKELDKSFEELLKNYEPHLHANAGLTLRIKQIRKVLKKGANPNQVHEIRYFVDMDQNLLKVLMNRGFQVNQKYHGFTYLHLYSHSRYHSELLIQNKADINAVEDSHNLRPIDWAKEYSNNRDCVQFLLTAKASADFFATHQSKKYDPLCLKYGGYPQIQLQLNHQWGNIQRKFDAAHEQVTSVVSPTLNAHVPPVLSTIILEYYAPAFKSAYEQAKRIYDANITKLNCII
jgi:hypothetical protein